MRDGDGYRSELAAAQARIAALEEQLAASGSLTNQKIEDLEKRRATMQRSIEPLQIQKLATLVGLFPFVLFSLIGITVFLTTGDAGALAFCGFGAVIGVLFAMLHLFVTPRGTKVALAKVEQDLEEARRLLRLEGEVKETRRLLLNAMPKTRVGDDSDADEAIDEEERKGRA